MPTTIAQAIQAVRAQRDFLLAETPVDRAKVRRCVRLLRELQVQAGAREPGDEKADIRAAFVAIRDTEQNPALFDEEEWREDATLLMQQLGSMPVDDQDPAYIADTALIRQDQVRGILRRTAINADTAFDPIREQCCDWLERFFDVYLDERAVETEFAADLSALTGAALDAAALEAALSSLESNAGRLKPPAQD